MHSDAIGADASMGTPMAKNTRNPNAARLHLKEQHRRISNLTSSTKNGATGLKINLTDAALDHIRRKGGRAALDLVCVSN
jgi:hypothetical protein